VTSGAAAARGGLARVGAYVVGQGFAVGAAALIFRSLGVVDGGRYVTVLSLVAVVQGLADAGLNVMGTRELAVSSSGDLLARLLGLRLVLACGGLVVAVAFAVVASYPGAMVVGVVVAGAGLVVLGAQGTLAVALIVRLRGELVAGAELARQVAGFALVVVCAVAGAGLVAFLGAWALSAVVALGVTVVAAGLVRPVLRGVVALARRVLPFAVGAAASVAFFRVTMIEMSLLGSAEETGLFAVSFRIVEVLVAVPALAVGTLFPVLAERAARGERARLAAAVSRTLRWAAAAGVAVALVLVVGAGVIVRVVAGPDFAGAAPVLRIQGLALACSFVAAPWAFALLGLGRERALAWVNGIGVLVALGVAAVLIEAHGARGAAVATVLGEAGLMVAFGVLFRRTLSRPDPR
jgi:O-antigen/teichoic acid export membrane protein